MRRSLLVAVAVTLSLGLFAACDDSASSSNSPNGGFDAGDNTSSGGTRSGGTSGGPNPTPTPTTTVPPNPGPGPAVLSLALPGFYAFVAPRKTGVSALENTGITWLNVAAKLTDNLTDLDRAALRVELNASAQGKKAGAIPVRIRGAYKPAPNVGYQATNDFVCAMERDGSSGRKWVVLEKVGPDPMTGDPPAIYADGCSWFLVERTADGGPKRYQPMVFWKGEEGYISSIESDAVSGYRVIIGERASNGMAFQLLNPDHSGPLPQ